MARTRSFEGCDTCRLRHVKCDTARPSCANCTKLGLLCGGYDKNAVFGVVSAVGLQDTRFRRPISTEDERQRMSDNLANNGGLSLAVQYLRQIEHDCEDLLLGHDINIKLGPFGVFQSLPQPSPLSSNNGQEKDVPHTAPCPVGQRAGLTDITLTEAEHPSPMTQALVAALNGQSDPLDLHLVDQWPMSPEGGRIEELFDLGSVPSDTSCTIMPTSPFWLNEPAANMAAKAMSMTNFDPWSPQSSPVSSDAVLLLRHYTTTVVNLLTPFRHTKTPWHILFIPHVKSCLAALAMNEKLDHASLCMFHSTLALSASSLNGLSNTDTRAERSAIHKQQAQQHARSMLKTAYNVPKVAKYKTTVMALFTMIQLSIFSGDRLDTEQYFLAAEKFIRLRGLKRHKSRKARLLHHCYVFERLFHESTLIMDGDPTQRTDLSKAVASSGIVVYGQDSPDFRLPNLADLEQSLLKLKCQEAGENDLHLAFPGDFPATMYPEVAAVPESYMVLLSLIVRLGKAKDTTECTPHDFLAQAKHLENAILRMTPKTQDTSFKIGQGDGVLHDMLFAMHEALVIYFYRRIYDIDASLLQGKARSVCDRLLRCETAGVLSLYGSTGFKWPAFIAACETEDLDVRQSFTLLFRRLTERSGFSIFSETLQDIEQVWHHKQQSGVASVSWVDLMKSKADGLR